MKNGDKSTVFDILEKTGVHSIADKKGLTSVRMKDVLYKLPKRIAKLCNPILSLTSVEDEVFEENCDDSEGRGMKIIIPTNIIDFCTRLEIILGLKLSGHTDTLRETSNLKDEVHKGGEIQK